MTSCIFSEKLLTYQLPEVVKYIFLQFVATSLELRSSGSWSTTPPNLMGSSPLQPCLHPTFINLDIDLLAYLAFYSC